MRRTIISAVIGAGLAFGTMTAIDWAGSIARAAHLGELQAQAPSEWLSVTGLAVTDAVAPEEPSLSFDAVPSRDLLIRTSITPREAETGSVICAGGGPTTLHQEHVPIIVDAQLSRLAGLDACEFPPGRYRVRLTFLMTDAATQVDKTLLVETNDLEVMPSLSLAQ